MVDGSFTTKMTVQWNLFGGNYNLYILVHTAGTVIKLGTERHRKLLNGIDDMTAIGCFGLTELGYGNNAVEMETTSIFDPKTKEWIIHTPSTVAQKYWITNVHLVLSFLSFREPFMLNGRSSLLKLISMAKMKASTCFWCVFAMKTCRLPRVFVLMKWVSRWDAMVCMSSPIFKR